MNASERTVWKVADALDRFERRLDEYYSSDRKHSRKRYRRALTARIPTETSTPEHEDWHEIKIWSRDVTPAGISFLATEKIGVTDMVVQLVAPDESCTLVQATIRRSRKVHDGFWEYGAEFVARVDPNQEETAPSETAEAPVEAAS